MSDIVHETALLSHVSLKIFYFNLLEIGLVAQLVNREVGKKLSD